MGVGSDLTAPGDIAGRVKEGARRMTRVLCVGECMVELSHVDERTLRLGVAGDTYNAAVYLVRTARGLGVDVDAGYLTGLGEDAYSAALRAAWASEGIADHAITVPGRVPGSTPSAPRRPASAASPTGAASPPRGTSSPAADGATASRATSSTCRASRSS